MRLSPSFPPVGSFARGRTKARGCRRADRRAENTPMEEARGSTETAPRLGGDRENTRSHLATKRRKEGDGWGRLLAVLSVFRSRAEAREGETESHRDYSRRPRARMNY